MNRHHHGMDGWTKLSCCSMKEERGISLVLDGLMTFSHQGDISTIYTTWTD